MSKLPDNIVAGLSVEDDNLTYKAIMDLLDTSIDAETSVAIGSTVAGINREWQCGRADALSAFKALIVDVRQSARKQRGVS